MRVTLAVVIPVYNVEPYIRECLTSVAEQDFTDLDVVMVDDGSTDDSALVAREFAARDPRFRLVSQPNQGLGAARNTGLRHISRQAEFIAFADSDDIIPPNAYSNLLAMLSESGSDLAAGSAHRLTSAGTYQFTKHARDFDRPRMRTTVFEVPGLLMDRTVWNKVYRRDFWDKHSLTFPEGMLYEDPAVTVPLYYLAAAVDVIPEIVYYWRIREGGIPSITQQRTISAMTDRFTSISMVRNFLSARLQDSPNCLLTYDRNLLMEEFPLFFDELREADSNYLAEFSEQARELLTDISPELITDAPVELRDIYSSILTRQTSGLRDRMDRISLDDEWRRRLFM